VAESGEVARVDDILIDGVDGFRRCLRRISLPNLNGLIFARARVHNEGADGVRAVYAHKKIAATTIALRLRSRALCVATEKQVARYIKHTRPFMARVLITVSAIPSTSDSVKLSSVTWRSRESHAQGAASGD
jgi:hypothetical protein